MKKLVFMCSVLLVASACSSSSDNSGSGSTASADLVQGNVAGAAMQAVSSTAAFSDDTLSTDRGYVSIGISDWKQTCALEPGCPGAQVNFTLMVMGGKRADVQPGVYSVVGESRNGFSYQVVGGAGRYAADCSTGGGFGSYSSGTVTVEAVAPRVKGTFDLSVTNGDPISGHFDALVCN